MHPPTISPPSSIFGNCEVKNYFEESGMDEQIEEIITGSPPPASSDPVEPHDENINLLEEIKNLIDFYMKTKQPVSEMRNSKIIEFHQNQCKLLIEKDYKIISFVNKICSTYPKEVYIPVGVKNCEKCEKNLFKNEEEISENFNNYFLASSKGRARGRFIAPAIFIHSHDCEQMNNFNSNKTKKKKKEKVKEKILEDATFTTEGSSGPNEKNKKKTKKKKNKNEEKLEKEESEEGKIGKNGKYILRSASLIEKAEIFIGTMSNEPENFVTRRRGDIECMEALGVHYVFDLMVENKLTKLFGVVPCVSSEKAEDRAELYSFKHFDIISAPFPGVETFSRFSRSAQKIFKNSANSSPASSYHAFLINVTIFKFFNIFFVF